MLQPVTLRTLAIAACGWLLACDASALTLGRARGAVLIGKPLELAIPVTLDAGEEMPCPGGDLFYGDTRVNRGLAFRWEPADGGQGVLHVSSSVPVDEPMLTLYLRAGCATPVAQRYVMLSEMPPEVEPAVVTVQAPAAAAPASPKPSAKRAPTRPRKATTQRRPRLKLEPLDLEVDRDPSLRLTSQLATPPATDPGLRQSAAMLWQVLQKGPDDALRDTVRLQAAERELRSLREVTQRNTAAVADLRKQVEDARGSRGTAALLVAVLTALLLVLSVWLAWRWRRETRVARVGRWVEANSELAQPPLPIVDAAAVRRMPSAPAPVMPMPPTAVVPPIARPPASRSGPVRKLSLEELVEIHEKAGFFVSIGERGQALALLETHVHDRVETSPLAWLDLLALYHRFGQRADYERVRGEFQQRFAAPMADFNHFGQPGASLEDHSHVLGPIVALWPSRRVLDAIGEAVFRQPGGPDAVPPLSLEAYRDLVLLYYIARDVMPPEEGVEKHAPAAVALDPRLVPPSSPRLGVDIDLDLDDDTVPPFHASAVLDFDVSEFEPSASLQPERKEG